MRGAVGTVLSVIGWSVLAVLAVVFLLVAWTLLKGLHRLRELDLRGVPSPAIEALLAAPDFARPSSLTLRVTGEAATRS